MNAAADLSRKLEIVAGCDVARRFFWAPANRRASVGAGAWHGHAWRDFAHSGVRQAILPELPATWNFRKPMCPSPLAVATDSSCLASEP